MNQQQIHDILKNIESGEVTVGQAEKQIVNILRNLPFENLDFARIDHHRSVRQGFPEVVFGAGKTPAQVATIAKSIVKAGHSLLVTRTDKFTHEAVQEVVPDAAFNESARTISLRSQVQPNGQGTVLIVAAGTSDLPVAEEARVTSETLGNHTDTMYDVGVAGIHRLLVEREQLEAARVLVVVAGMEGALPSVIGGLVRVPVIAVPTSIGYGASFGGLSALLGMLNSCASGVAVVNIDNGFGGAAMASTINHLQ